MPYTEHPWSVNAQPHPWSASDPKRTLAWTLLTSDVPLCFRAEGLRVDSRPFLERRWFAIDPEGRRIQLQIRVGFPEQRDDGMWYSRTEVLDDGLPNIDIPSGLDGWSAVNLALFHAWQRIDMLEDRGWQFFWEEPGDDPDHPTANALKLLAEPIRTNRALIEPGQLYLDRKYHPCVCIETSKFHVWGVSLVDGSMPRTCDSREGEILNLSAQEAYLLRTAGPQAIGLPNLVPADQAWWPVEDWEPP
jgi:hypothetical protein